MAMATGLVPGAVTVTAMAIETAMVMGTAMVTGTVTATAMPKVMVTATAMAMATVVATALATAIAMVTAMAAVPSRHYVDKTGCHIYSWSAHRCSTYLGYTRKVTHQTDIFQINILVDLQGIVH